MSDLNDIIPSLDNNLNSPPPSDSSSSSSPPPEPAASLPPTTGGDTQSPPPSSASASPPSPDQSSSSPSPPPPSTSDSPPPSPSSPSPSTPSPPSNSGSSPASDSPPPKTSTPSPPSPSSSPPSPSDQPPSKPADSSPPPPSSSHSKKPPPTSETPPSSPNHNAPSPSSESLAPPSSDQKSPPTPETEPPPSSPVSPSGTPPVENKPTPSSPNEFSPPTISSSNAPPTPSFLNNGRPSLSSPTSDSKPESSSSSGRGTPNIKPATSQSNGHPGTVVGVAVAGVFIIALIALLFMVSRRRRKRQEFYAAAHYMPAGTLSVKSEGYYQGQQHNNFSNNSGPADSFYGSQGPNSFILNNSYGSQRGNVASHGGGFESGLIGGPNPYFSYEELMEITNGFSSQNVLGEGGFGCVYKGWLPDGKVVAVKQLKAGSGQGEREFKAEVEIISRVHHRHLVSLVGYCISEHHRLLVYEFVPNQTLEHHLHGDGMPVLDWAKRLKIALGAAKGLAYLHEDCHPKIIHRDIKSANILLDDAFEAQVADFGLAKPSNDTHTHVSTRVMGTFGYMAPEYASSGKLTDRSDVFSFGVVLLELITGRKPVDPSQPLGDESLVEWARPLLIHAVETGELTELVDPRLEKHYVESEMIRMIEAAAASVRHSAPKRPRMVQVARALDCEAEMSDLSNGVKYGQSTIYDSGQYNQDIMKFRRMALGGESSEYDTYSGEFNSREVSSHQSSWNNFRGGSSGESETRAFTTRNVGEQRYNGPQSNFAGRRL